MNQSEILSQVVTNCDRPVFGIRNLPEEVKGALFARYSRSSLGLRELLLQEFLLDEQATTDDPKNAIAIDQNRARQFYDRVLGEFGDDSVAELGGAHIALEGISNIAAKAVEDNRIGLSPLEKSSRYVVFERGADGQYPYYRQDISDHAFRDMYDDAMKDLFDTYHALMIPLREHFEHTIPGDRDDPAWRRSLKCKVLDCVRGLLPMATKTNVGLYGNGRAFEHLLLKLSASRHIELQSLAIAIKKELDHLIPSFVKRVTDTKGAASIRHLRRTRYHSHRNALQILARTDPRFRYRAADCSSVTLVDYDSGAEIKAIAAILYPELDIPWADTLELAQTVINEWGTQILEGYTGDRPSRHQRPGRAFEEVYYTFEIVADMGVYRDLQRHRILTPQRQAYTVAHGFEIPAEIENAQLAPQYRRALEHAGYVYEAIADRGLVSIAEYVVPFASRQRWRMKMNLRELYHFVELRSQRQGHAGYRAIAQQMYREVQRVHPLLVSLMDFVDLGDYQLERLTAEEKRIEKLKKMGVADV